MRRLDLDPLADEHLEPLRRPLERIAFWHAAKPTIEACRPFIGVRWWLGVAFAVVAAMSTAIVVSQFSNRSENRVPPHAEQVALHERRRRAGRDVIAGDPQISVATSWQGSVRLRALPSRCLGPPSRRSSARP